MSITDLQEIAPNQWKAKYHGNYGIYTIKIKTDGYKTVDFSCSCPSSYYPCKHIPIVEEAIREQIAKREKNNNEKEITIENLLKDMPQKKLCDFIVNHAPYNPQLKNAILLEFTHTIKKKDESKVNNYNQLLQDALVEFYFDFEDIEWGHYNGVLEIDVLDKWLDKAQEHADPNNPKEAILICKACIEEYAAWCEEQDSAIVDYLDIGYQETPFNILNKIYLTQQISSKELLDYCKTEMLKPKYERAGMYDRFSALLMKLSVAVGSDDFITLQDKLLKEIEDKSSYAAKEIFQQKIDFYRHNKQPEKAEEILKENLQIEQFREEVTRKLITENRLQEAKKLINDFISQKENENKYLYSWYKLKLQIAQKENNILEIRRISFRFIESKFESEHYNIYKKTFSTEEWTIAMEKLIKHYEKRHCINWFNSYVAEVLLAEKQAERLMKYIEKHLNIDVLERYYTGFSSAFPEKTVALFRQVIDQYAQNTGREIYERIAKLFEKMVKIEGGKKEVMEMVNQYKILYKNRKAMMEIINKF
jgi:hypothetical protein